MVDDAIVVCRQGLLLDPSARQRLALERELDELMQRREEIVGRMGLLARAYPEMPVPPAGQADAVAALAAEVECLSERADSAAHAMQVVARVLTLAGEVAVSEAAFRDLGRYENPAARGRG
jgi:hypothetical protein